MHLQDKYKKVVVPAMMAKFGYKSVMAVPRIAKVVVNTGIGRQAGLAQAGGPESYKKFLETIAESISLICGQKPKSGGAKKSIAEFKIRKGMVLGYQVTMRGNRMHDFLDRLINIVLPRIRDFRGINSDSFGRGGNLTIGIKEHIVFPEISHENIKNIFGLEVTVVTNAKSREEGVELLKLMGMPIKIKN